MKSVLYCGCTVNAYMPFHGEHSLSLLARTSLFLAARLFLFLSPANSLSLSDSSCSTSLFARYLARWPPAQPMKARGGELLRRSYGVAGVAEGWGCCLRNVLIVSATPTTPGNHPERATILPRPPSPQPPSRPPASLAVPLHPEFTSSSCTPLSHPPPVRALLPPRSARERPTASYGTVLRILMDRLRNCWRN